MTGDGASNNGRWILGRIPSKFGAIITSLPLHLWYLELLDSKLPTFGNGKQEARGGCRQTTTKYHGGIMCVNTVCMTLLPKAKGTGIQQQKSNKKAKEQHQGFQRGPPP